MKVHLFGLPISLHRRLKEDSKEWENAVPIGHSFRATPVQSNQMSPFADSEMGEMETAVQNGFTHIVIPANRSWAVVKRRFQFDCRIHIARLREPLRDLTWPLLREGLHKAVEMDATWLEKFCPRDLRHALLLPPLVFEPERETAGYWTQCDAYSTDRFDAAERLLSEVERRHRLPDGEGKRSWVDARGRRFRFDPSKHGQSSANRAGKKSFRFCFEVPIGFHYDVALDRGGSFTVRVGGKLESVTHCNTNPWGRVWRGKEV